MGSRRFVSMAPPRVLFLVNTLRVGGFERDVATLCQHIDLARFRPEVWILRGGGQFENQVVRSGICLRNFGRKWARSPFFALKLAHAISRINADLIHAFLPSIATYAALARTSFGVRQPMVLSIGQSQTVLTERWMFRWCSRTFDWLVANSPSAAELGVNLGFAADRISIIPNGHQIDQYVRKIDCQQVRASLGVRPHERLLLYVGRLIDTKRVCDAIDMLPLLGADLAVKLVIAGDGPEREALQAQVSKLGLTESVVFMGQRQDVPDLLQAADIFLFPSETEGLPNSLIEACLARLPIVACRVGGVVDVVKDNETALLASPRNPGELANGVLRLLRNPAEAQRLAAAAQIHARRSYGVDQSLKALYDVYERLLDARRNQRVIHAGHMRSSGLLPERTFSARRAEPFGPRELEL
jgi:glycosyltransferase involved in cell wall biosynthesis